MRVNLFSNFLCVFMYLFKMCSFESVTKPILKEVSKSCPETFPNLNCQDLKMGQYFCNDPEIDVNTQQPLGCSQTKRSVEVNCHPVANICCDGAMHTKDSVVFKREVSCKWTNGKYYSTSLLLSIFFGWLGIDRFYLGYPALGLLKMSTFGFMFFWTFADIVLIALQILTPADGSDYIVDYYGPKLENVNR